MRSARPDTTLTVERGWSPERVERRWSEVLAGELVTGHRKQPT
ncbi:hypothetical protein [Saccharomonospora cyanea]|nr:hypothetical protein [Saccharomonospora cyanea]